MKTSFISIFTIGFTLTSCVAAAQISIEQTQTQAGSVVLSSQEILSLINNLKDPRKTTINRDTFGRILSLSDGRQSIFYNYTSNGQNPISATINNVTYNLTRLQSTAASRLNAKQLARRMMAYSTRNTSPVLTLLRQKAHIPSPGDQCAPVDEYLVTAPLSAIQSPVVRSQVIDCGGGGSGGAGGSGSGVGGIGDGGTGGVPTGYGNGNDYGTGAGMPAVTPSDSSELQSSDFWTEYFAPDFTEAQFANKGTPLQGQTCSIQTSACMADISNNVTLYVAGCGILAAGIASKGAPLVGTTVGAACLVGVYYWKQNATTQCQAKVVCTPN